jgi:hypothetical protein
MLRNIKYIDSFSLEELGSNLQAFGTDYRDLEIDLLNQDMTVN